MGCFAHHGLQTALPPSSPPLTENVKCILTVILTYRQLWLAPPCAHKSDWKWRPKGNWSPWDQDLVRSSSLSFILFTCHYLFLKFSQLFCKALAAPLRMFRSTKQGGTTPALSSAVFFKLLFLFAHTLSLVFLQSEKDQVDATLYSIAQTARWQSAVLTRNFDFY